MRSVLKGFRSKRLAGVVVALFLLAAVLPGGSTDVADASYGDVYTEVAYMPISVAVRILGPWGTNYASAHVVDGPDGPRWVWCVQAPVPGSSATSTETDISTLSDYNSPTVQANEHKIRAVVDAPGMPSPGDIVRRQRNAPVQDFDFANNEIPLRTNDDNLVLQYAKGPPGGHSYYDSLPFEASLRIEIAARQAAIWTFSEGYVLPGVSGFSDQRLYQNWGLTGFEAASVTMTDIYNRYLELVAIGNAATAPTPPSISISGQANGSNMVFNIATNGVDNVDVSSSQYPVHPYDTATGTCDSNTTVTNVDTSSGSAAVCMVVVGGFQQIELNATGSGEQSKLKYLERGDLQDLVADGTETVSASGSFFGFFLPSNRYAYDNGDSSLGGTGQGGG